MPSRNRNIPSLATLHFSRFFPISPVLQCLQKTTEHFFKRKHYSRRTGTNISFVTLHLVTLPFLVRKSRSASLLFQTHSTYLLFSFTTSNDKTIYLKPAHQQSDGLVFINYKTSDILQFPPG